MMSFLLDGAWRPTFSSRVEQPPSLWSADAARIAPRSQLECRHNVNLSRHDISEWTASEAISTWQCLGVILFWRSPSYTIVFQPLLSTLQQGKTLHYHPERPRHHPLVGSPAKTFLVHRLYAVGGTSGSQVGPNSLALSLECWEVPSHHFTACACVAHLISLRAPNKVRRRLCPNRPILGSLSITPQSGPGRQPCVDRRGRIDLRAA